MLLHRAVLLDLRSQSAGLSRLCADTQNSWNMASQPRRQIRHPHGCAYALGSIQRTQWLRQDFLTIREAANDAALRSRASPASVE